MENEKLATAQENTGENKSEGPQVLEEIVVEELSIDGVCGVY